MDVHSWTHSLRHYSLEELRLSHKLTCSHVAFERLKGTLDPVIGETLGNAIIALEALIAKKQGELK